jgi:hypothetical protein
MAIEDVQKNEFPIDGKKFTGLTPEQFESDRNNNKAFYDAALVDGLTASEVGVAVAETTSDLQDNNQYSPIKPYTVGSIVTQQGAKFNAITSINQAEKWLPFDSTKFKNALNTNISEYPKRSVADVAVNVPLSSSVDLLQGYDIFADIELSATGRYSIFNSVYIEGGVLRMQGTSTVFNVADISSAITTDAVVYSIQIAPSGVDSKEVFVNGVSYGAAVVDETVIASAIGVGVHGSTWVRDNQTLVHFWNCDESTGDLLYDSNGGINNANGGTVGWKYATGYTLNHNYGYTPTQGVRFESEATSSAVGTLVPVDLTDVTKSADGRPIENTFSDRLEALISNTANSAPPRTALSFAESVITDQFSAENRTDNSGLDESGNVVPFAGFSISAPINVRPLTIYTRDDAGSIDLNPQLGGGVYDENDTWLAALEPATVATPATAAYVRLNCLTSKCEAVTLQQITGVEPASYCFTEAAVIGDSFARGLFDIDPAFCWPSRVATILGFKSMLNAAQGGTRIADYTGTDTDAIVNRIDSLPVLDKYYFEAGFNDYDAELTSTEVGAITDSVKTTLYGALNYCFSWFQDNAPEADVTIVAPHVVKTGDTQKGDYTYNEIIDIIVEVALKYGLYVVDLRKTISVSDRENNQRVKAYRDTVHLTPLGDMWAADIIGRAEFNR